MTGEGRSSMCRHCGEPVIQGVSGWWAHNIGPGSVLIRCDPVKSGQPYGVDAAPSDDASSQTVAS